MCRDYKHYHTGLYHISHRIVEEFLYQEEVHSDRLSPSPPSALWVTWSMFPSLLGVSCLWCAYLTKKQHILGIQNFVMSLFYLYLQTELGLRWDNFFLKAYNVLIPLGLNQLNIIGGGGFWTQQSHFDFSAAGAWSLRLDCFQKFTDFIKEKGWALDMKLWFTTPNMQCKHPKSCQLVPA